MIYDILKYFWPLFCCALNGNVKFQFKFSPSSCSSLDVDFSPDNIFCISYNVLPFVSGKTKNTKIVPRIEKPEYNQKVPAGVIALLRFEKVFVIAKAAGENVENFWY